MFLVLPAAIRVLTLLQFSENTGARFDEYST